MPSTCSADRLFAPHTAAQLCINFANEKLQQFFLIFIFKAEETLYTEEELEWTRIEYSDNQGAIDLVEKSPSGKACLEPGAAPLCLPRTRLSSAPQCSRHCCRHSTIA